jgi:ABC-2 type transport system permease protein
MDKIFLRFVTFLTPVLEKTGVDTDQLYYIIQVKLMMDNRRPRAGFTAGKNSQSSTKVKSPWAINVFTVVLGFFIGMVLFISSAPYIAQTLYFTVFMVMLALTLISDFTTVLMDPRDQYILLPRPVNDRTIAVSRILHITIYVLRLALLQGAPGLILVGFVDGIAAVPLFFVQILEATFVAIFSVNIVYLLLMRMVSAERFKDIISYVQVGFSVLIFATYYLLPKLINFSALNHISLLSHKWAYALPPVWITALNELLIHRDRSGLITGVLAVIGITVPLLGLWLIAKVLAPGFNRRLAEMSMSDGNSDSKVNTKKAGKFSLIAKIGRLVAPGPVENAGFMITWKLASRMREFKIKSYPAFAYVPIYFIYFALKGKGQDLSSRFQHLQDGHSYIFLMYMCSLILAMMLTNISMSTKYKSSWVYYALPINKPGQILSGMYKAIVVVYFIPYCLLIGSVIVAIWGPAAINDIIVAMLASLIYGILMALFLVKGLPFSRPVIVKQGGGRMLVSFCILGFIAGIGFVHYFLMRWETFIWLSIIPLLGINWLMFHYYKKQTWDNIELAEV